jgi:hypothetical protein
MTSENNKEEQERTGGRKEENRGMTGIAETTEIIEPMVIAGTKEIVAISVTRTSSTEKQGSRERKKGEITRTMQIAETKEIIAISVTGTGSAKRQGSRERKRRKITRTMQIPETKEIVAISVTGTGSAKRQGSRERKRRKITKTMVIAETKEIVAIRQGIGDIETIRLSASFLYGLKNIRAAVTVPPPPSKAIGSLISTASISAKSR